MKIALIYNKKRKPRKGNYPQDYYSEFDSKDTVNSIALALQSRGHRVAQVEADKNLFDKLKNNRPDFVFNIAEGIKGVSREAQVPTLLDLLGIPCTGSGALALALTLDKAKSKKIFKYEGIPTPGFQVSIRGTEALNKKLTFPLIVKPNREGSAKGISSESVVHDEATLRQQVKKTIGSYKQEALVEEFIEGKELTVAILGNFPTRVLPVLEIDFSNCAGSGEYFYSWKMKEFQGNRKLNLVPAFHCPARLSEAEEISVKTVALRAHQSLGCVDFSRTDIRLDKNGTPYVLEVNPLPGLDPAESNYPHAAKAAGIGYEDLINTILDEALKRHELQQEVDTGGSNANRILAAC